MSETRPEIILREIPFKPGNAYLLQDLVVKFETARRQLEESLAIRREIGDKWGIAACLTSLGDISVEEADRRLEVLHG